MGWLPSWYLNLARVVVPYCPDYINSTAGPMFIMIDYAPIIIAFFLFVAGMFKREKMMFTVSILLSIDMLFNWFLRGVVFASYTARYEGCGDIHELPSVAFQHSVYIAVIFQCLISLRKRKTHWKPIFLLYAATMLTLVARVYLGINRASEMLLGTLFGLVGGVFVSIVVVRPLFKVKRGKDKDQCDIWGCSFHIEDTLINNMDDEV